MRSPGMMRLRRDCAPKVTSEEGEEAQLDERASKVAFSSSEEDRFCPTTPSRVVAGTRLGLLLRRYSFALAKTTKDCEWR